MGIKEEITKIAVEQGYEGAKPKSIAQAIDALTDTLAGEDVKSGRSVVDAIRKYAPYVGSGGGGTTLGAGYMVLNVSQGETVSAYATRPDDLTTVDPNIEFVSNDATDTPFLPAGTYVAISATQNGKALNEETRDEIDFEIRETVQGSTTFYDLCFVMPEFHVWVNLESVE